MFGINNADIFRSQANLAANSFSGPINQSMMNPGWGINPNLLTPSYDAPYRPQWAGNGGAFDYTKPGFFRGLYNLGPWNSYANTNPVDNWHQNINSVVQTPFDVAAFAVQRIAAPILAFKAANHFLGPSTFMGAFRGEGFGAALGQKAFGGVGAGFARGIGANAAMAGRMGSIAGAAGSAIGSFVVPYAVAQAGLKGFEKLVGNPYINDMKTAESLYQNFQGITFGDATGNSITGRGLGYKEAMGMSQDITRAGIRDMMFSTKEYRNIADMSMRAGLLDNSRAQDITKNIKQIAEQIKLVMAISKDPSVQGAIESLAKLQMAGASRSAVAGIYNQIGINASIAGASVQKLMDTVGAQGEYLYRQNGMTPYLGQMAAANSYAGFASAHRLGLISNEQLARMGGLEGATQSSLTAQINGSQTLLGKFMAYNRYLGNTGQSGNVVGSVARFGQSMSRDPLGTLGSTILYGNQAAARMMKDEGTMSLEEQVMQMAKGMPGMLDKNGKLSAEKFAVIAKYKIGLSDDQIQAYLNQVISERDPGVRAQSRKATEAFLREQTRFRIDKNYEYGGAIGGVIGGAMRLGRDITVGSHDLFVAPVTDAIASLSDKATNAIDEMWYGGSIANRTISTDSVAGQRMIGGAAVGNSTFNVGTGFWGTAEGMLTGTSKYHKAMKLINSSTDKDVVAARNAMAAALKDPSRKGIEKAKDQLAKALRKVSVGTDLEDYYHSEKNSYNFAIQAANETMTTDTGSGSGGPSVESTLNDILQKATGTGNNLYVQDKMAALNYASNLIGDGLTADTMSDFADRSDMKELKKIMGGSISYDTIEKLARGGLQSGLSKTAMGVAGSMGSLDEIMADPYHRIKDKTFRKQFMDAQKAGKGRVELSKMLSSYEYKVAGTTAEEARISSRSSLANLRSAAKQQHDANNSVLKGVLASTTSNLDTSHYEKTVKTMDSATNLFADAVDKFAATQGMSAKTDRSITTPGNSQNSSSGSWLSRWFQ